MSRLVATKNIGAFQMTEFKIGDTVRLKSSPQQMNIVELDQANGVKIAACVWINSEGKEERGTYPRDALATVTPKEPVKLNNKSGPGGPQGWMA
jgi:uncharacterized protein YodC (DUF2158 family)